MAVAEVTAAVVTEVNIVILSFFLFVCQEASFDATILHSLTYRRWIRRRWLWWWKFREWCLVISVIPSENSDCDLLTNH